VSQKTSIEYYEVLLEVLVVVKKAGAKIVSIGQEMIQVTPPRFLLASLNLGSVYKANF